MQFSCFLLLILCIVVLAAKRKSSGKKSDETIENDAPANATITKWQYCEGCKETVNLFSIVSAAELAKMQKEGKLAKSVLEIQNLVTLICDNEYLTKFQPFIKYSCMKIMDEYRVPFLKQFEGSMSSNAMTQKLDIFERKKNICVDEVKACAPTHFKARNPDKKKCSACMVIAQDIETLKKIINHKVVKFRDVLESEFCNSLGYKHNPYSWLESLCDEIIEDKIGAIIEIIQFHDKIARTGLNPSQTMPQMMCEEFYGCKKEGTATAAIGSEL